MHEKILHSENKPIILVMTATFPYGSGEGFLISEFRALKKFGINIIIAPLRLKGKLRPSVSLNPRVSNPLYAIQPLFGLAVLASCVWEFVSKPLLFLHVLHKIMRSGSIRIRMKNLAAFPKATWLAQRCRRLGVTHIHAHWASTTATCAMAAAELAGIPWSFTCHRWDIYENNLLMLKSDSASFVRFISYRGAQDGVELGVSSAKANVIPMGIDLPCVRPTIDRKTGIIRIVCAANLEPVKGHKYLIMAAALLKKRNIPFSISLVGDGPIRKELQLLVHENALDDFVTFYGNIDHSALMKMYEESKFDLFVLPSIDLGYGVHEGVPVSLMEAMAHGMPVISTTTGSIPELLGDDLQCTVLDKDAAALAVIIEELAVSESRYNFLAEKQWNVIENWSVDRTLIKLVNKLL